MKHATIEELLQIKDGQKPTNEEHINSCDICQHTLESIQSIQQDMQNMRHTAPDHIWKHLVTQQQLEQQKHHSFNLMKTIYALAATVLITIGCATWLFVQKTVDIETLNNHMKQLIANSQTLENIITAKIDASLSIEAESLKLHRLKWRLQLIDQEMQSANQNIDHQISLWQDRIRTLQAIDVFLQNPNHTQQL